MSELPEEIQSELDELVGHFDRMGVHEDISNWIEDGCPDIFDNRWKSARFRAAVEKAQFFGLNEAARFIATRLH